MRIAFMIAAVFVFQSNVIADDKATRLDLHTGLITNGIALNAGQHKTIYSAHLDATLNATGEGKGIMTLDPNRPNIDEFGYPTMTTELPLVKFDCAIKLLKKGSIKVSESRRVAAPLVEVRWIVYEIQGKPLRDKVTLALLEGERFPNGTLLVHDEKGQVRQVARIADPGPPEPCHPGCFPAGTRISVPGGTKAIDAIRAGDSIETISKEGLVAKGKVESIFITKNRLIEVVTDLGTLVTTETQPLALVDGTLRAAGEVGAGDQILAWNDGTRTPRTVRGVNPTGRYESVYNLVLGEPTLFLANGFLVRSKPPAQGSALSP